MIDECTHHQAYPLDMHHFLARFACGFEVCECRQTKEAEFCRGILTSLRSPHFDSIDSAFIAATAARGV
jgi:hypothetical protein